MKFPFFILLLTAVSINGCKEELSIEQQMDPKTTVCYTSVSGRDTAWLRLDTSQVIGLFEMNYPQKEQRYLGQFKGLKSGDTIKGHWDFKVNNLDKWHRNPVAFLKKDDGLVMGVGKIIMVWGGPHFDDQTPIDYQKGKFVFELGVCGL